MCVVHLTTVRDDDVCRKQMLWRPPHSQAVWEKHLWTGKPSACGTTEREMEIVLVVWSGEDRHASNKHDIMSHSTSISSGQNLARACVRVCSPQPADTEGTVQFDGEGYAAVSRPTRWNPNISTVMFKFRTFSTDAVIMYFATKDMVKTHTYSKWHTRVQITPWTPDVWFLWWSRFIKSRASDHVLIKHSSRLF